MSFWNARYVTPGWIFAVLLILLDRYGTFVQGLNTQWSVALTLVAFLAGAPIGYIIHGFFSVYYQKRGGSNCYFPLDRLRKGLLQIYTRSDEPNPEDHPPAQLSDVWYQILTGQPILEVRKGKFLPVDDRALYTLFWQSVANQNVRDSCHRRWEVYHVMGATVTAVFLAVLVSAADAALSCGMISYLTNNIIVLPLLILVSIVLIVHGELLATQAASQELLWVELFLDRMGQNPEPLSNIIHMPHQQPSASGHTSQSIMPVGPKSRGKQKVQSGGGWDPLPGRG